MKKLLSLPFIMLSFLAVGQTLEGINGEHLFVPGNQLQTKIFTSDLPVKQIALKTGVTLEYVEQGQSTGTAVVLLHGFSDSWHSYEIVLPHLSSALHVFAISQRGHGNSSKGADSYLPHDFAADVAAFLKAKGIKEAVIVGHSMGSTIAQCFAVNFPSLTKAVVLVSSFADYHAPVVAEFKTVVDALSDPVDSIFITEFQKSTILKPTPGLSLDSIVNESRKLPAKVWKGVAAGWKLSDFRKQLPAFRKPSLILWGDKDLFCPRKDQDELRSLLKASTLLVYEGVGHALHWEEPKRFAEDLQGFIKSLN
jgi:non-heme chloroperoxidase